jgi:enoyl-CoA hydratase/carnithine racemase
MELEMNPLGSAELIVQIEGALAIIVLDCEAQSNALTEGVILELCEVFPDIVNNSSVETICFRGRGPVFSAGIDLSLVVRCLRERDIDRLLRLGRKTLNLFSDIQQCSKLVVAWVHGAVMGGGLELALACHRIVAAPTAKFALPETGLGIYPGLGGTQRTPRRVGVGLAKWMIYTGSILPADQALEIGLIDAVCAHVDDPHQALQAVDRATRKPPMGLRFKMLERLFFDNDVDTLLEPSFDPSGETRALRALLQMRANAPIALRLAEQIIDRGMGLPLGDGIDEEFGRLREVFSSEDARRGVASVGRRKPEFVGR